MSSRPLVLSMGDPAGVGPELIWRAWQQADPACGPWAVVGHAASMRRAARALGLEASHLRVFAAQDASTALASVQAPHLTLLALDEPDDLPPWGEVCALGGRLAARSIEVATRLCLSGQAAGLVTAPIHKQAMALAGWNVPGHTEMLQQLAAEDRGEPVAQWPVRMMLANPELQTVLHSIHVPLQQALGAITSASIWETLCITQAHARRLDGASSAPRIAVAGVNPHAGEGGRFGREELDVLAPVVARAQSMGWQVSGPWAPDTVFMRARAGEFDVVVAMYHDQGLIPVKYLGLDHGVNVTLGLPFVRTSPDHGTAMDLAGQGLARPDSLLAAMRYARRSAATQKTAAHGRCVVGLA